MEGDIRVMNDLKSQIDKQRNNFKKSPKERITESYVTARLQGLEELIRKFSDKHESIVSSYDKDILDKSIYVKNDVFDTGYENYLTYKGELMASLNQMRASTSSAVESSKEGQNFIVRLPKISIPVFSGNYMDWFSFKDLFKSLVHDNQTLDDVQRLHYLKTQLQGEAEQLIKHIPVTSSNYRKCWDMLINRYDNKRFMSNCILKRLFGQRMMITESAQGLKDLLNTTSDCMHELSNLGINTGSWDIIIIYIVSLKLDTESRKQWELYVNNSCENLPSFDFFKEFLESRYRALEFIEPTKPKVKTGNFSNSPKVLHTTFDSSCPHCDENHKLFACSRFAEEEVSRRHDIVKSLGLCFNCLNGGHSVKFCRVVTKCRICKGRHHTLLHAKSNPLTVAIATESEEVGESGDAKYSQIEPSCETTNETTGILSHFVTDNAPIQTLLATALIKTETKSGFPMILRALLDQGSQASFISEASVQLLRLNKIAVKSRISGLGGGHSDLTSKYMVIVNIQSLHDPTFKMQVKAHVLNTVTSTLPEKKFISPNWTELGSLNLADPQYNMPNKIDMLLGSEVYCTILKQGLIRSPVGLIIAQDTYLGWVLSGQISGNNDHSKDHNVILNLHVKLEDNELLKKFWEIESEPNFMKDKSLTPEEQACETHFEATTRRDESGRYIVELPFRPTNTQQYGDTRAVATKRLISLEKRLSKNPQQKKDYSQVLKEYETLGHMEEIKEDNKQEGEKVWLPHHAVIKPDRSTTKTRVVFNASDKSANGLSLNDTLMVGPTLQPELRHTIMRWRLHPVCLTADIIKMYRQIKVADKHADYQRIVWREDVFEKIRDYRLLTVTFGTSCAPYLAVKVLQQVAIDEGAEFPLAAHKVKTDFYMDDLLTGCQTESEAVRLYEEMNGLLKKGGFELQKWATNRTGLLNTTKKSDELDRNIKEDDVTKVVGLSWNRRTDEFDYHVKLNVDTPLPETKREIMGEICRLYDPLGWISPCIIIAKIFIQKLWLTGLNWDDKLPEELLQEWGLYRNELSQLNKFHIPRWVEKSDNDVKVELHGFSDASNAAYAAVVYIRCITVDGNVKTHLLTAKTKVAPIKQISVPRLELCAAVLVTKLLREVAEILNIEKDKVHAWTDSTVVLAWLNDHPSRWKTFIANRTAEVLNLLNPSQWSFVPSKENPADCASRGISPSELLKNQLWMYGPHWLQNNQIQYVKPLSICTKTDLEAKSIKVHLAPMENNTELLDRFSSFRKLIRVVAYCRRILHFKKGKKPLPYLTAREIQEAIILCVRLHQSNLFHSAIESLRKGKNVDKKSSLSTLNPFLDMDGILRVGGRLERSDLPERSKHPFIIHGDSHFAKLIIADAHEKTLHGGQQLTCSYVRSKYWVIKLKTNVRDLIHDCVPCIRNAAKTRFQLMGQLPACRAMPEKPFLHTGVDYAGPINIRVSKGRGQKSYKGYICLFICMATRAIHIEVVSDMTSEGFLAAFKRFVARRGRCSNLWSDNGTTFVGAAKELKHLLSSERSVFSKEVANSLATNGTEWHFIPPHAPNFGGLWEAGIKSTKHHLRRVIGDSTLTYEEITTVLSQIEACLNSRPLSQISTDSDDFTPLTPGHFLVGEPLVVAPDFKYNELQVGNLRRWQLTQRMVQIFWKRWSREYLTMFFQRYKWKTRVPQLKIGDVVLVREDNLPPAKWLYGRIIKVHPGKDDITRVVTLRYKGSIIQRPTSKLCPLPCTDNSV